MLQNDNLTYVIAQDLTFLALFDYSNESATPNLTLVKIDPMGHP